MSQWRCKSLLQDDTFASVESFHVISGSLERLLLGGLACVVQETRHPVFVRTHRLAKHQSQFVLSQRAGIGIFQGVYKCQKGANKLKQTQREKPWKHESIKENQRLKWLKKHQHAQRKTTSSYFGASTKTPEDPWINESINREQDSQQIPLHPALSHLRKLRSIICQVADALRSLSRWLLSEGSPLLQRAILGEKLTLSWGHYVIPFWVQMKKR